MNQLMNFLQAASNTAASNVSGPVDLIAEALRAAGVPVPRNALLSSEWMREKGLTSPVQQGASQVAGDTLSLLAPVVAAAKAPQIARGLLSLDDKAMDMTRRGVERYMDKTGMRLGAAEAPTPYWYTPEVAEKAAKRNSAEWAGHNTTQHRAAALAQDFRRILAEDWKAKDFDPTGSRAALMQWSKEHEVPFGELYRAVHRELNATADLPPAAKAKFWDAYAKESGY